jgi:hypothetical protein
MKRKMMRSRGEAVTILVLVFVVGIAIALLANFFYLTKDIIYFDMDVNIDASGDVSGGFNLDEDAIHFGIVGPTASSYRKYPYYNPYGIPVSYKFFAEGDIKNGIIFSIDGENYGNGAGFDIGVDEVKEMKIVFDSTRDPMFQESGYYQGKLKVVVRRQSILF